jgi:ribosomal protein S18 acetylase RimI-like enzyme
MNNYSVDRLSIKSEISQLTYLDRNQKISIDNFDCVNSDLNDYFYNDWLYHDIQLFAKTYKYTTIEKPEIILGLVSISNDAIKIKDKKNLKIIPNKKRLYSSFPAIKICRLGVNKEFQNKKIGSDIITLIKQFFTIDNRTGCRYITVDAYNEANIINFYEKNNFRINSIEDEKRKTRTLYCDLLLSIARANNRLIIPPIMRPSPFFRRLKLRCNPFTCVDNFKPVFI